MLAQQAHAYLSEFGLDAGMMMGAQTTAKADTSAMLVASQQTLTKRGFAILNGRRAIFLDEAHIRQRAVAEHLEATADSEQGRVVVGLTATPFPAHMGAGFWDGFVQAETTNALIKAGHLVRPDIWVAESVIDMRGAKKTKTGEWTSKEAEERGLSILGDIVQTWITKTKEHFGGPVKSLVFSPTRNYGLQLVEEFRSVGHRFVYIGDRDGLGEMARQGVMRDFREGKVMGLISCEALGRGLDVPDVFCSVHARPRRNSLSSHLQETGRVLRPAPGKEKALIIDHCQNFPRFREDTAIFWEHGFPGFSDWDAGRAKRRQTAEDISPDAVCRECGFVMMVACEECPSCGEPVRRAIGRRYESVEVLEARFREFNLGISPMDAEERLFMWEQIVAIAIKRGKTSRWAKGQYKGIMDRWPPKSYRAAADIVPAIESFVWKRWCRWVASRKIREQKAHSRQVSRDLRSLQAHASL